jgi:lysophospholipase L1-like esterase
VGQVLVYPPGVATVLIGDSHLARIRRDLPILGSRVRNAAEGGASAACLSVQASSAGIDEHEVVVVSVGTNDAAPWKGVPLMDFERTLTAFLSSVKAHGWVYVAPPGVVETRLNRTGDRSNRVMEDYRTAAIKAFEQVGARVVRTDLLVGPLGDSAFAPDGLHLNAAGYRALLPAIADATRDVGADLRGT